jgi:hypothetical protein
MAMPGPPDRGQHDAARPRVQVQHRDRGHGEGQRVRDQVIEAGVHERREQDAGEPGERARPDAKRHDVEVQAGVRELDCPQQRDEREESCMASRNPARASANRCGRMRRLEGHGVARPRGIAGSNRAWSVRIGAFQPRAPLADGGVSSPAPRLSRRRR